MIEFMQPLYKGILNKDMVFNAQTDTLWVMGSVVDILPTCDA